MNQFFTFEGIDGSGKSTIINQVAKKLEENSYSVVTTFEPTDTWLGQYVQQQIKTQSDPFVTAFTFIADRIQHSKEIQKWIDQGNIVLCDRYAESTYAYQSVQLEKTLDNPVKWLQDLSKNRILTPDRTFYFQITADQALDRIKHRDELISFEKKDFLQKVQRYYDELCEGERFIRLDATQTIEDLTERCVIEILSKS